MQVIKAKIDHSGRILIPVIHRKMLHLTPGQDIVMQVEEGELRIRSFKESAKHARDLVKKYNPKDQDLVDLLFQARKEDIPIELIR